MNNYEMYEEWVKGGCILTHQYIIWAIEMKNSCENLYGGCQMDDWDKLRYKYSKEIVNDYSDLCKEINYIHRIILPKEKDFTINGYNISINNEDILTVKSENTLMTIKVLYGNNSLISGYKLIDTQCNLKYSLFLINLVNSLLLNLS